MNNALALALVVLAGPALAQDLTLYNRALSQFNAGQLDEAVRGFHELTESSTDPDTRAKSEYYLAQALARKNLPFSAFIYYAGIVTAGQKHPFYLEGVRGLVDVQAVLDDQYLIPIVYVDPRHPGGPKHAEGIRAFQEVLSLRGSHYVDLIETQHLATLGLGRTFYGTGEYAKAVQAYESIPRFTKYWDEALFENGFARFQNDDYGGAPGPPPALPAPH